MKKLWTDFVLASSLENKQSSNSLISNLISAVITQNTALSEITVLLFLELPRHGYLHQIQ
ncbi:hypothetical protein [Gilliamella apicola]|uniref:hypothetical protein n=1 Tax=Gilliamella apicola TaxID=1196095 RepID=UPI002FEE2CD3